MKVIYNKFIPFKGFIAINLFGVVFMREEYRNYENEYPASFQAALRHEAIHTAQMREMLYIGFYIWYFVEWVIKLFKYGKNAYYNISFEKEAAFNNASTDYLKTRKHFAWLKLL